MKKNDEVSAIRILDETLNLIDDPKMRDRILRWASTKFSSKPSGIEEEIREESEIKPKRKTRAKGKTKTKKTKKPLTIDKDLNLKPPKKRHFVDFADEKKPGALEQKCALAVYYLSNEVEISNISVSQINTCFRDVKWKLPKEFENMIHRAGSLGFLDSSDMNNILIKTGGINLVEHDLPKQKK